MSIHPSLKTDVAGSQQRSVLSRIERIKDLMKKGLWKESQDITGLPKTKILKIKAKKVKAKAEETAGAGTAAPAGAAKTAAAKPAAAKPDAAKKADSGKDKK